MTNPRSHSAAKSIGRPLAVLTLLLATTSGLVAQQPTKIAVVDLDALFYSASEGQKLRSDLADLEKATKSRVETIARDLQAIRQEAIGKPAVEQREASRRLEDGEREARRIADNAKRSAAKLEQDARDSYNARLEPLLRQIQEEEGFDLILNKTPGIVVFASTAIDMSQSLLAKLEPLP